MSRIIISMMIAMGTLLLSAHNGYASCTNTLTQPNYGNPPQPFTPAITAAAGEDDPYLYDLSTSLQVSYWGGVVDGIGSKFSGCADSLASLNTTARIWKFIGDNNISIHAREAQLLCLFMTEDDEEPSSEVMPNWPSSGWPYCGGILETMFGPDIIPYLRDNANDGSRLAIYQYLLGSMGINAKEVEPTINARMATLSGPGPDSLEFEDDVATDGRICYTPANNIVTYDVSGCGVLCTVTKVIMGLLNTASQGIVDATANNPDFSRAILAVLVLYITLYGAMVVLGMVNVALADAIVRVVKLSVIAMLLTSSTVMTLFHMARCFFIEGTTYLVNSVMMIGLEAAAELGAGGEVIINTLYDPTAVSGDLCGSSFNDSNAQGPLVILEGLLSQVFSAHMGLTLITLMMSTFYGFILGIFLIFGLFGFVMSLLGAVTIYLTALIGQYLLLSLLPFFVVFLLFERTTHLFQGWLNQLITYSLTPIFLFAYLSLFVVVVSAALAQILDVRICWAKWFSVVWVFDISKFHFFNWGDDGGPMVELPFGFFEVLIFVLLVFLMKEFEDSVEMIARDIGNSYIYVNKAARELQGWFRGQAAKVKAAPIAAAKIGGAKIGSFARGSAAGHKTTSSSGQRGVGGIRGGAKAAATVKRSGGGGR